MVKILHTSDLHLDSPFLFLRTKGKVHRQQLLRTFEKIINLAVSDRYDLMIIAGDLFDDNAPSRDTVNFVTRHLENLRIPVVILPGNHDCYDSKSIYRLYPFPSNVHLVRERESYLQFPTINLTVAGNPIASPYDNQPLVAGLSREKVNTRWYVIAAHGSLQLAGKNEGGARVIRPEEIASSNADYIALGDWHSFAIKSQGNVIAAYSGAPEPISLTEEGAGKVVSITLSEEGAKLNPITVGHTIVRNMNLDIANMSEGQVIARIKQEASPNLMLTVNLTGAKNADEFINLDATLAALKAYFYHTQIKDKSIMVTDSLLTADYPDTHVIGRYVRMLQEEINLAKSDEQRRIAEQALQLGILMLQGKEVLK